MREAHAGHGHRNEQGHGSRGVEARLVVDPQAPAALQAAERLLDLPAAGLDLEALAAWGADDLGGDAVTLEGARIVTSKAAVEPDQEERGVGGEVRGEALQRVAVLRVGRHHPRAERIALRVDHQHPLAALGLLVRIVAPRPALRSGPHALRADDRPRWPALPTGREAAAGDQDRERPVQHSPPPPAREAAPRALVRWQPPPGAAVARQMPQ